MGKLVNPTATRIVHPTDPLIQLRMESAILMARRSGIKSFSTGAVIYKSASFVSSGWSHYSELTLANYRSIHAEIHALLRADRSKLNGANIYIATIRNKSGNIGVGRPCEHCLAILDEVGIRFIYYTYENQIRMIDLHQAV